MDDLVLQARSFVGLFALAGVAWLLGPRKKISIVLLVGAIALQLLIAWLLYSVAPFRAFLQSLTGVVAVLQEVTNEGAQFVFGYLAGSEAPWETDPAGGSGFLFAFQALPMVIVLSALSALLWRWRILEFLVRGFAAAFRRLLNLSGSASLGAAANIFLGMTESPVLIRPRLPEMTRSDLFLIMTVGFSTVAGSVMALYVSQLSGVIDGAAGHIFTASLISVPAAVLGKFLAAWAFTAIALALTFPLWVTVNLLGDPDNGVILAGYVGSLLMAGGYLAIASCLSATTQNQVIAFVVATVVCFAFTVSGAPLVLEFFAAWAPQSLLDLIAGFSFLVHFNSIVEGVIDLRDLVYFASLIAVWLFANWIVVEHKKQAG
jgi:hypothetical protein